MTSYLLVSRLSGHHRPATADAVMSSSFHGTLSTSHTDSNNQSNQLLEMTQSLIENFTSDNLMTQSLDSSNMGGSIMNVSTTSAMVQDSHPSTTNGNLYNDQSSIPIFQSSGPFVTASKMMPVPESLMSPDCAPPMIQQRPVSNLTSSSTAHLTNIAKNIRYSQNQRPATTSSSAIKSSARVVKKHEKSSPSNSPRKAMDNTTNSKIHQNQSILKQTIHHQQQQQIHSKLYETSTTISSVATTEDEDDDEMNVEKLKSIHKVAKKSQKQQENNHQQKSVENRKVEYSAILIQKLWRGYNTRKKTVRDVAESLQQKRTQDYIFKLTKDMEMTKQALENERKIQQLQMQAINALWKKVSNMQTIPEPPGSGENGTASGLGGQEIVQTLTKTCSILTNQVNFHATK